MNIIIRLSHFTGILHTLFAYCLIFTRFLFTASGPGRGQAGLVCKITPLTRAHGQAHRGIAVVLLAVLGTNAAASGATFNLTQVAPGVYVHHGRMVSIDDPGRDDIANIGFIVGSQCVAVIDTGGSVRVGEQLRQAIRQTTRVPVCYVINTHIHYDHVLGNAAFADPGVEFIGHAQLAPAMQANKEFFLSNFRHELGKAGAAAVIPPGRLVQDTLVLDLGGRKLLLTAYPPAHTNNDLSVYDEQTRTLWLSDLLFMQRLPALDGSLKGWLAVLHKLTAMPADRAIPGHGPVSAPWPQAAADEIRYLRTLRDQIRERLAQGQFMEQIVDQVGSKEKTRWQLYQHQHKRNVSRAFAELEWE